MEALLILITPILFVGFAEAYWYHLISKESQNAMFFEDKRTAEERKRDMDIGDKMRAEAILAIGCLKQSIRPVLVQAGFCVGLVGNGNYFGGEMLIEVDGVTYKLSLKVDHDN